VNNGTSIARWLRQRFNNSSLKEIATMNNGTQLEAIQQHQLGEVTGGNAGTGAFNRDPKPAGQPSQYGQVTVAPGTLKSVLIASGAGALFGAYGGLPVAGLNALRGGAVAFAQGLRWHETGPQGKPR
jgi:hypothetical protein